ncbi:MAG: glycosyl hydrolase [Chthonomonadales bacterium]
MLVPEDHPTPADLLPAIRRLWDLSARKIRSIEGTWSRGDSAPVVTVAGRYVGREWTDWTLGFRYGSMLLQFDATGEAAFLHMGRQGTYRHMVPYLTHAGVHDHGFHTISTWGNLWRMMEEGRIAASELERMLCDTAIRVSGITQARRWTSAADGGFIYSFNGPHSLFADTMRTLRVLGLAHRLGGVLMEEGDRRVSLLERLILHAQTTARYIVSYGEGRDVYDAVGRVAHEALFDAADGSYRCPSTQQGYSPFTTWTRGLAWVMLGFAELLQYLDELDEADLGRFGGRGQVVGFMRRAAQATASYYLQNTPADGVPYWDTGAPGLARMGDYLNRPAEPFNDWEPVDASAAAIAAQALMRLGLWLQSRGKERQTEPSAAACVAAGLAIARTLLEAPYLAEDPNHQGLLLHCVYHRPRGWDYVPPGRSIPCGEASMWGDYHVRELALLIQRLAEGAPLPCFFGSIRVASP